MVCRPELHPASRRLQRFLLRSDDRFPDRAAPAAPERRVYSSPSSSESDVGADFALAAAAMLGSLEAAASSSSGLARRSCDQPRDSAFSAATISEDFGASFGLPSIVV